MDSLHKNLNPHPQPSAALGKGLPPALAEVRAKFFPKPGAGHEGVTWLTHGPGVRGTGSGVLNK